VEYVTPRAGLRSKIDVAFIPTPRDLTENLYG